ncbi:TIGR04282 family arsenosugar biosynthesis glycosyltransferase [Kibdelosporangium phytohabitans]|uniref:Glycosyltransferase involved in cell wall biogenesis n=1 Tax=Kibdelosporangium phytohabitans TaxID=860235 RepID=A0A0N9HJN9_9PSEU|nr:DUF2064 domain-containing protein [Kibdelosporangium phytohabitans]ALG06291.1 glycosyltransferase involved in cell wall biogenesis [Kibdelosporangium phytohabitans]MBE1467405.1 glycosyltransferase A (GT-A) superfamily protein (DUF2064 family) [Kibdelosporangium phytohabitans]
MSTPLVILVLAKAPRPGLVKTRLSPPATPVQAAHIAAAALLDTVDAVCAVADCQPIVALAGDLTDTVGEVEIRHALRAITVIPQRGRSLGERIAAAHLDVAKLLPGRPTLQIGMDTPQLNSRLLEQCRERLMREGTDAVLGAATDGGWWVLGLRDPAAAACVTDVPTSRSDTGHRTAQALRDHGLRLGTVATLSDVDTIDDARDLAASAPGTRFAGAVGKLL